MASTINISEVQLYNSLREKLGEKQAETLVTYIKTSIEEEVKEQVPDIATKDFVSTKIAEVETKIAESKFQLILWAFVFWATQLGAMFAFLKFLK